MSSNTKVGIACLGILCGIFELFVYTMRSNEIKNPQRTVATLTSFTMSGGKGIMYGLYKYTVKGKEIQTEGYYNTTLVPGDKFLIAYEREEPQKAKIIAYEPVFLANETVSFTEGIIKEIGRISGHFVVYEYTVENITYRKVQEAPPEFDLGKLKEGNKFKVIYSNDLPNRSKISFEEQIK